MTAHALGTTTAAGRREFLARVAPARSDRGKQALTILLALLYPWHFVLFAATYTGTTPPIPHGGLNASLGDIIVLLICVTLVLRLGAGGSVPLPRYLRQASVWYAVAVASVTVNALSPEFFFELRVSVIGLMKLLGAVVWMIAVFWLLRQSFPRRFVAFASTSVLAATGFSVWSVIQNLFMGYDRAFGPFENANIYGNYLVLNLFLAIGVDRFLGAAPEGITVGRGWRVGRPLIRFGAVTILILGLLATGSRGAFVGLFAGLVPAVPWRALRRVRLRGAAALVVGGLLLGSALTWYLAQDPFVVKRWTKTAEGEGPNVDERFALWQGAVQAFSERPILGMGYAQYPDYAEHQPFLRATVTHQTYLATAAELGIVGFMALLWLLLSVIWDSWRVRHRSYVGAAHACCGFVVAACTQGLFNNVQQERSLWIVFAMIAAMLLHISRVEAAASSVMRDHERAYGS